LPPKKNLNSSNPKGSFPPALQILGEICSNFFVKKPPSFTFSKIETGGITNPTIETLQKIAKALEVQVDDLLK